MAETRIDAGSEERAGERIFRATFVEALTRPSRELAAGRDRGWMSSAPMGPGSIMKRSPHSIRVAMSKNAHRLAVALLLALMRRRSRRPRTTPAPS